MARGKRLITCDISNPAGRRIVRELIRRSDVVIENFRAGAMERLGLGYEDLAVDNPKAK